MILRTLVRADWRLLVRDRAALFLTFVLPLVFFTIFAFIFGGMSGSGGGDLKPLRVIAIDSDGSELSGKLLDTLFEAEALVRLDATESVEAAVAQVREGEADAAVVVEVGFEEGFGSFGSQPPAVRLVFDAANPMARFTIEGLLQAASFQAAPVALMESGFEALEQFGAGATPAQRLALGGLSALLEGTAAGGGDDGSTDDTTTEGAVTGGAGIGALIAVDATAATERDDGVAGPSIVDYYAAAIGVMFLLFSMTGAAGALLEEEERGTLERLLMSGVGIGPVLLGHWLFFALIGSAQLALMFVFAWLVFGLDLMNVQVLVGVSIVGVVTAAAASAFALFLAAACRTRAQLSGLSTVVILIMSAVGGSMVPRFIMPAIMDTLKRFTFNGWALDGFLAVLWQRDPDGSLVDLVGSIALPVGVLLATTVGLLYGARRLARRWETL